MLNVMRANPNAQDRIRELVIQAYHAYEQAANDTVTA